MEFPKDIICIIMAKLPVKSLMRFEIVSKTWFNLIQDPRFRKSYTNNCVSQSSNSFILSRKSNYRLEELSLVDKQDQGWKKTAAFTLNSRFLSDSNWRIVATCNGLLCLANRGGFVSTWFYKVGIIIYNPITGEGAMLPELHLEWEYQRTREINFGYDAKTNKYKVAVMYSYPMIHIISVGEKSWRKLDYSHAIAVFSYSPMLAASSNEEFFWFIQVVPGKILVLDISYEKFRGIDMDEFDLHFYPCFLVYGKYITVITSTEQKFGTTRMHAWELIDSKKGIWKCQEMRNNVFTQKVDMVGNSGGDRLLLKLSPPYGSSFPQPRSEFAIYNPKSGEVFSLFSSDDPEIYDVFSFEPTLASLKF